ncbi:DnaJ domain containing protein [Theileria equi strain WA]|uniref:DnaJ domain containing protein n=1 Tax=Theileria equi strain WA TaxID=1537102 RepID=L1LED5_THEEQ|nr:DnaJ domain containing protein [Theileria equi strain WA]EKX73767.1 DnaJ domain containing protein [Theileria equi strain WA]|eukprot:XP_004833219.1 DnaJ domain containing protein [Theileria equi strain WA]
MKNYYTILGIAKNATRADIRKAYLQKAKLYHPDLNKSPSAATKFKEISEAYNTLYDVNKRRDYDSSSVFGSSYKYGRTTSYNTGTRQTQYRNTMNEHPFNFDNFEEQFRAEAEQLRRQWQQMEADKIRREAEDMKGWDQAFKFGNFTDAHIFISNLRYLLYLINKILPLVIFPLVLLFYTTKEMISSSNTNRRRIQVVYDSYGRAYSFDTYGRRYRMPEFDKH